MKIPMVNPSLPGHEIYVPELGVDGHRRSGWVTTEEADKAKATENTTPQADKAPEFDKPAATTTRRTTSPASVKE